MIKELAKEYNFQWKVDDTESISDLLDIFFDEYSRTPQKKEFEQITGISVKNEIENKSKHQQYKDWLELMNYDGYGASKTFELLKDDKVIYYGLKKEVAEKLGENLSYVDNLLTRKKALNGMRVREKKFDENVIIDRVIKEIYEKEKEND